MSDKHRLTGRLSTNCAATGACSWWCSRRL